MSARPIRRDLYAVIACTTLPVPREVVIYDDPTFSYTAADIDLDKDARADVDAWAQAHGGTPVLGSPAAPRDGKVQRTYRAEIRVAGWDVTVRSYVYEPAGTLPTEDEHDRAAIAEAADRDAGPVQCMQCRVWCAPLVIGADGRCAACCGTRPAGGAA